MSPQGRQFQHWHSAHDPHKCHCRTESSAGDPRRRIPLTADQAVTLQLNQEHTIDLAGLVGVFDRPRSEAWTGVTFVPMQSPEWLYLWLACVLDTSLCSMSVEQAAIDAGVVEPMFRASTMAVPGERELAYLTWRLARRTESGGTSSGSARTELEQRQVVEVWLGDAQHVRSHDLDDEHFGQELNGCVDQWLVWPVELCSLRPTETWMCGATRSLVSS